MQPMPPPNRPAPAPCLFTLCELVRDEYGRLGVQRFLCACCPYLPCDICSQAACRFGVELPPPSETPPCPPPCPPPQPCPPPRREKRRDEGMDVMQLLRLMEQMKR